MRTRGAKISYRKIKSRGGRDSLLRKISLEGVGLFDITFCKKFLKNLVGNIV
jgi:hypothetical protein